jgi:hypothetical protein
MAKPINNEGQLMARTDRRGLSPSKLPLPLRITASGACSSETDVPPVAAEKVCVSKIG